MAEVITREELELVQKILDKFNYPVLFELHLDEYWNFTVDSELWHGVHKDELDYCDDAFEGCRIAGDFMIANVRLCTGVDVTKVFSMNKQIED
ncbi:hypothetical protein D3C87_323410 [compost metagenome]